MILDFLFPKHCLECNKYGKYMCDECIEKVLDGTFDENNFSIFKYRGVIKKTIVSLKYKFAYDVTDELVLRCIQRINVKKYHNVLLVPIPLYWQRENWRGFNQSELIGEKLANKLHWKFIPDLLIRRSNNIAQATLKREDRVKNLNGVFDINSKYLHDSSFKNSNILIFDDVYTTGSTINEAKKVLLKSNFSNIYSITIAR